MISSKELKKLDFAINPNGYDANEVDSVIAQAADTIDAYQKESEELYHKLEVLATKIEEYRSEENAIKTALVTAEKMAEKIKKESSETASALITRSQEEAEKTMSEANAEADKIVSNARSYTSKLINDKTNEANDIIADAQNKANEAINSAKIVAQDILDQAKQISDDLISKSKAEKEAYEILTNTIKNDAKLFIEKIKALYNEEIEALNSANLETSDDATQEAQKELDSVCEDVSGLVEEIEEVSNFIPENVVIQEDEQEIELVEEVQEANDSVADESVFEQEPEESDEDEEENAEQEPLVIEPAIIELDDEEEDDEDDEFSDPMAAVEAFSQNTFTPSSGSRTVNEIVDDSDIEEQGSLFDDEAALPFESYFNVKREDVHNDKTQTISLIPPEDDEEDDEPRFRGFFKKKK